MTEHLTIFHVTEINFNLYVFYVKSTEYILLCSDSSSSLPMISPPPPLLPVYLPKETALPALILFASHLTGILKPSKCKSSNFVLRFFLLLVFDLANINEYLQTKGIDKEELGWSVYSSCSLVFRLFSLFFKTFFPIV